MSYVKVILLVLISSQIFGQKKNVVGVNSKSFSPKYFLIPGEVYYSDNQIVQATKNTPINILKQVGDSLFIRTSPKLDSTTSMAYLNSNTINKDYILLDDGYTTHLKFRDWDTHPLAIPIKIRPSLDDNPVQFAGEISVGSYIGYQTGKTSITDTERYIYAQTISLFAAPSMIKIDPTVADTDNSNLTLGFSLGLAYIVNLNDFQIGLVGGVDYISGDASKTWIYQGQPWFSFTIGFDFNDEENN